MKPHIFQFKVTESRVRFIGVCFRAICLRPLNHRSWITSIPNVKMPGIPHPPKIGKNVQRLRKRVGYNLDDLSRRCGVSKGMLSQIEGDRTNPTLATIWKIAHGLGVRLEELFDTPGATLFEPVHADQVTIVQSENGDGTFRIISPLSVREVETYVMEIRDGGEVISTPIRMARSRFCMSTRAPAKSSPGTTARSSATETRFRIRPISNTAFATPAMSRFRGSSRSAPATSPLHPPPDRSPLPLPSSGAPGIPHHTASSLRPRRDRCPVCGSLRPRSTRRIRHRSEV